MADTDDLRDFVPAPFPIIDDADALKRYFANADKEVARRISVINQVMKKLEARIEALEP